MPVMNDYEATIVCGGVGFYSRADNSASYPNCNGTYEEQLSRKERITYHYRSKPNPNQYEFFEAQAVKIYEDEKHFFALVVFGILMISWKKKLRSRIN